MKFGRFDDSNREYVIHTPQTPLPWINYLGNNDFFSLISNTCGGYSFYKDAKLLRLTRYRYNNIPYDTGGKYYYIKDQDTVWNPGWQPMRTTLDSYECRHGMGYSKWKSSKNGLEATLLAFVPLGDNCEINQLTLVNNSDITKNIKIFSFVEWCMWNADDDMKNFQRLLSCGEVEIKDSIIYHKTEYRERRNHYAFFSVNRPIDGFDTDREAFLGAYNGLDCADSVKNGNCMNSIASGWSPIASHQLNITLAPGETTELIFILGYEENSLENKWESHNVINKAGALAIYQKYEKTSSVETAFTALRDYWNNLFSSYQLESKHTQLNRMVNIWNQYQCMITFLMSRSASYYESGIGRGMGFRDSCQDLLGFVHLIPKRARERIIDIASTQFLDGSAYHQYRPLTKRGNSDIGSGFNDDPLWLIACVSAYVRETGDTSVLTQMVPYDNEKTVAEPMILHLKKSFDFTNSHKGPHGLPLIGRADWNDCLNLNCFSKHPGESFQTFGPNEGPIAESVFIGGMFVKYGEEYAQLCELIGDIKEAAYAREEISKMYDTILSYGWDGNWFIRAYDAYGNKVGSKECKEGQIYIEPQGFCVLAGVGVKEGFAKKALDSVKEKLDTDYGIMLLQPAYTTYYTNLGEISSYPPGYKENAGIFCHNNPWVSIAETVIGRGEQAFEIYKKTCPAYLENISEIHRTEPYVYSQMIAGADAPRHGEAKNSWLTGTAAWSFVNISQYILGIYPTHNGLFVNPCVPKNFDDFKITRKYRNTTYDISVFCPSDIEKGVKEIYVDDVLIKSNIIPYNASLKKVHVKVIMG